MPVPPVQQTVSKYLESARLLQTPEAYAKTEALAKTFVEKEAPKLQWILHLKSWWAKVHDPPFWCDAAAPSPPFYFLLFFFFFFSLFPDLRPAPPPLPPNVPRPHSRTFK